MKNIFATLILLFFFSFSSFACDCSGTNFIESAEKAEAVLIIEMLSFKDYKSKIGKFGIRTFYPVSFRAQVKEVYKGEISKGAIIKVFGGDEARCLMQLDKLRPSYTYLIGLYSAENYDLGEGIVETPSDFHLSLCGEYILGILPKMELLISDIDHTFSPQSTYNYKFFMKRLLAVLNREEEQKKTR